uniref:Uncharacterized protein n=1 Tax=Peronospora matthiolae TaxID=2874970 RepID=A0AAV1TZD7_9STRA
MSHPSIGQDEMTVSPLWSQSLQVGRQPAGVLQFPAARRYRESRHPIEYQDKDRLVKARTELAVGVNDRRTAPTASVFSSRRFPPSEA